MNRYYMTAETRQHLIAESNRLIAARAAANAARPQAAGDSEWSPSADLAETPPSDVESAFARLVAELQVTSSRSRPS